MGKWWGDKRLTPRKRDGSAVPEVRAEPETQPEAAPVQQTVVLPEPQPVEAVEDAPVSEPIAAPMPESVHEPVGIPSEKPAMNTSIRLPIEPVASSGAPTVIRAGLHLDGNIRTTNDILLEGSVRGEVTANSITVAAGATLSGNVAATVIVVDGMVEGVVRCLKLQVNTTGSVSGEIHHSILVVEAGAAIEGTVFRTDRSVEEVMPAVAVQAAPVAVAAKPEPQDLTDDADEALA